jgi:hypothetical protein
MDMIELLTFEICCMLIPLLIALLTGGNNRELMLAGLSRIHGSAYGRQCRNLTFSAVAQPNFSWRVLPAPRDFCPREKGWILVSV